MSSFRLQSGDSEFNNRVDALFSSLQTVAVDLESIEPHGTKRAHEDDDEDDGIKDEFCRPQGMPPPAPWRRGRGSQVSKAKFGPRNSTPDYVKNPNHWTRYNMKDTKVLSDRENKIEGLKFFHDLQSRRMEEEENHDNTDEVSGTKIIFKKPTKPNTEMTNTFDQPNCLAESADGLFGGSNKIKLDEYEVGKAKSKCKPKKVINKECETRKEDSSKEIKLGYLLFEEEEEDV